MKIIEIKNLDVSGFDALEYSKPGSDLIGVGFGVTLQSEMQGAAVTVKLKFQGYPPQDLFDSFREGGLRKMVLESQEFTRLNITEDVLDKLGFSESWGQCGDYCTRDLEFKSGTRYRIIETDPTNEGNGPYGDYLYCGQRFYFDGSFAIPAIKNMKAYTDLNFLDEMFSCIATWYPDDLEEFYLRCKTVYMESYLPVTTPDEVKR